MSPQTPLHRRVRARRRAACLLTVGWDLRPCRFDKGYFWGELASLIAAFNVAHGTVISSLYRRHRSTEFTKFLVKIDTDVPDELEVHPICDNYAPHHDHLAAGTPAVPVHFTPTYSFWINQMERFFASSSLTSWSAATTDASKHSRRASGPGPTPGTTTSGHSSRPNPPTRSSPHLGDFSTEPPAQDSSRPCAHWRRSLPDSPSPSCRTLDLLCLAVVEHGREGRWVGSGRSSHPIRDVGRARNVYSSGLRPERCPTAERSSSGPQRRIAGAVLQRLLG